MATMAKFWRLDARSDRDLLASLGRLMGSGRRLLAEQLAHLGEVEERRLHLDAGCRSMFAYCVTRLGMSEDEACRRIDVARLARRFPALFPLLAGGRVSLSVAALLKPHLTPDNAVDLLAAASGRSVRQARELLAARFPGANMASGIRKSPERRSDAGNGAKAAGSPLPPAQLSELAAQHAARASFDPDSSVALNPAVIPPAHAGQTVSEQPASRQSTPEPIASATSNRVPATPHALAAPPLETSAAAAVARRPPPLEGPGAPAAPDSEPASRPLSLEPLVASAELAAVTQPFPLEAPGGLASREPALQPFPLEPSYADLLLAGRSRIQFIAGADLKRKLELARDLLRHTSPDGDFAPVVERALDLLIEQLMKGRFEASARRESERAVAASHASPKAHPQTHSDNPVAPSSESFDTPMLREHEPGTQTEPVEPSTEQLLAPPSQEHCPTQIARPHSHAPERPALRATKPPTSQPLTAQCWPDQSPPAQPSPVRSRVAEPPRTQPSTA